MSNESRHPGEGAAASNVKPSGDDTSLIDPTTQELAPNPTGIAEWLHSLRPHIHVWVKKPDGYSDGRYFGNDVDSAIDYVADNNANGLNSYFTFNIPSPDCGQKPSKEQIVALRGLHVDVDPPKDGSPFDKETVKNAICADYPTVVVDSGRGIHAYWHFPEPIDATPENVAAVEALNRALVAKFNGDAGAWNRDRVMRVPDTINRPDKGKRAAGYGPTVARVVVADSGAMRGTLAEYQAYFLPPAPATPPSEPQAFTAPSVGPDAIIASLQRSPQLWAAWNGDLSGYADDNNRADMAIANAVLARCGYNVEQAKAVLLYAPLPANAPSFNE